MTFQVDGAKSYNTWKEKANGSVEDLNYPAMNVDLI